MTEGTKLYDEDDADDEDDDGSRIVKDEGGPDIVVDIIPEVADVGSVVIQ